MFGPETFIERIGDDALAPDLREGQYAWIDPDEPARDGRLVAVWADGPGSATRVRAGTRHRGDLRQRDDDPSARWCSRGAASEAPANPYRARRAAYAGSIVGPNGGRGRF